MLSDIKFKVTKKSTGKSAIISLNDLYGYEGETSGILIKNKPDIPQEFHYMEVSYASGGSNSYDNCGNEDLIVEPLKC